MEQTLFNLLAWIERLGVWLSILAWFTVAAGALIMGYAVRRVRGRQTWGSAILVGMVALIANLSDYFVTLYRSPDLSYEANPLWRNIVDRYGLTVAKWYGLTGKILVSTIAAEMFAWYLANRGRLYPEQGRSLLAFLTGMGGRSLTLRERAATVFTIFAFFFATLNVLYFYIAFTNYLQNPDLLARLPSAPAAIMIVVAGLVIAFVLATYRAYLRETPAMQAKGAGK